MLWLVWSVSSFISPVKASDTMLMFVGEDLEVLSIASRKEESAWSAPAVVNVLTRNEMDQSGVQTLSQALDDLPGFHVETTNRGSIPYLRGIPNSALIFFDTVPIGSGAERENNRIDYETSLVPVKRIEVIRGPGSVLWGPDAFAGVVNAVPFTGKDFSGVETGLTLSSADQGKQAYLRHGADNGNWASFFSLAARHAKEDDTSTNVARFWSGEAVIPSDERVGTSEPDDSHYLELYGNISVSDRLILSAKLSESQKAFSVTDWDQEFIWEEQKSYQSKLFKLEASKNIDVNSGIRFTGYYSDVKLNETILDRDFQQDEYSVFGELIYERAFFSSDALLTVGMSYKEDHFNDILVWDAFYPSFLNFDNDNLFPDFFKRDYENTLVSVFSQYRHKIGNVEVWGGLRNDDHDRFEDKTSFSSGVAWSLSSDFLVKGIYGSGYRTPFTRQLIGIEANRFIGNIPGRPIADTANRLEQIKNMSLQLQYKPNAHNRFALTVFRNDISDHVVGDRYEVGGISLANRQTIDGIELEWKFKASDSLSFFGNVTFLDNSGPDETFLARDLEASLFDDDGNLAEIRYIDFIHSYDTGPNTLLNLSGIWQVTDNIQIIPQVRYFSQRELYYSRENETRTFPGAWLCNLRVSLKDIQSFDIDLFVNNIFNTRYRTFDAASDHHTESISAGISIRYRW